MEPRGTALLTNDIPAQRALTTTISREEIAGALQHPDRSPELYLDLDYGEERSTVGISWSYDELESLFERTSGDQITLTFDRDELESLFGDVEAHGIREKALIFTVAVAGALGSGATIANAAPTIGDNPGAASIATVQKLATDSIATTGGVASNVHTPGLQTGDPASTASTASVDTAAAMASAASIKLANEPQAVAADSGVVSNVHTPGLQTGDEQFTAPAASTAAAHSTVADDGVLSNVHTPGVQIGPGESTAGTRSVQVSAGSSSGEFLGIDTRDATEALIAGGVLLAIAGATFAGTRRPGAARPA
ncbi:MAG TPA: hypothetical protein VNR59_07645 [Gaiellaceae bacterium]|nr:hypothetical protein [Gaiellaceae bacterium]